MAVNADKVSRRYLQSKVKEYKRRINDGNFTLELKWETEISRMKFIELKEGIAWAHLNFNRDFEIIHLNLDKVVNSVSKIPNKRFPKGNMWPRYRKTIRIAELIDFIEKGNLILPPILTPFEDGINLVDGNHRIGICRFLGLPQIPFTVQKEFFRLDPSFFEKFK